jgi:hypothetical protein
MESPATASELCVPTKKKICASGEVATIPASRLDLDPREVVGGHYHDLVPPMHGQRAAGLRWARGAPAR